MAHGTYSDRILLAGPDWNAHLMEALFVLEAFGQVQAKGEQFAKHEKDERHAGFEENEGHWLCGIYPSLSKSDSIF
jgi:hypothetical protein